MDELVQLVSEKTGLAEDKSRVAVDTVINFLKQKLPEPVAGQIDGILSGEGNVDEVTKSISGFLGKK